MKTKTIRLALRLASVAVVALLSGFANADTDFEGSKDHPDVPRVSGTRIAGYDYAQYDAGRFAAGVTADTFDIVQPEGQRTRIIYFGQESQSSLQMFRNYQRAFAQMGSFTEIYRCERLACIDAKVGDKLVWEQTNKIPHQMGYAMHYENNASHENPMYLYGTVQIGDRLLHVSVFTSLGKGIAAGHGRNRPIVHLEVLEAEDFKPSLASLDASELAGQLATRGHVAVYGINFDYDSADLQAASAPVIAEVAKGLATDPALRVFVVGHTDNAGALDYNQSLSAQRAAAVVAALVSDHGIDADRLTPVGVGPVAPKASNDDDAGRALNRRVEIVRR